MNNEDLIKKLEILKKSEESLKNATEEYTLGFGHGYNHAIDKIISLLKDDKKIQS